MDISIGQSTVLTGDAVESDVTLGKTFYNTDTHKKLVGTMTPTALTITPRTIPATTGSSTFGFTINCTDYNYITVTSISFNGEDGDVSISAATSSGSSVTLKSSSSCKSAGWTAVDISAYSTVTVYAYKHSGGGSCAVTFSSIKLYN